MYTTLTDFLKWVLDVLVYSISYPQHYPSEIYSSTFIESKHLCENLQNVNLIIILSILYRFVKGFRGDRLVGAAICHSQTKRCCAVPDCNSGSAWILPHNFIRAGEYPGAISTPGYPGAQGLEGLWPNSSPTSKWRDCTRDWSQSSGWRLDLVSRRAGKVKPRRHLLQSVGDAAEM